MITLKQLIKNITKNRYNEFDNSATFYRNLTDLLKKVIASKDINIDDFITYLYELSKQFRAENSYEQGLFEPLQLKEIKDMKDAICRVDHTAAMYIDQLLAEAKLNEILITMRHLHNERTIDLLSKLYAVFNTHCQLAIAYSNLSSLNYLVFYTVKYKIYFIQTFKIHARKKLWTQFIVIMRND
jgi:hypothetical protein